MTPFSDQFSGCVEDLVMVSAV